MREYELIEFTDEEQVRYDAWDKMDIYLAFKYENARRLHAMIENNRLLKFIAGLEYDIKKLEERLNDKI